jgi:hypothetical protein
MCNLSSRGARLFGERNSVATLRLLQSQRVMPGLVPGIHALKPARTSRAAHGGAAWMAGTSPAMTSKVGAKANCIYDSATFRFPQTAMLAPPLRLFA